MIDRPVGIHEQQVARSRSLPRRWSNVSEMSQSISAATEEQTTNAKQVSKAVENVNEVTQSAASAAEEMSSATEQLSSMAQELQRLMAQFKIGERSQARPLSGENGKGGGKAGSIKAQPKALLIKMCMVDSKVVKGGQGLQARR